MENIIFVRNLSLFGIHGKDALSKKEKREFIFDIEVSVADIDKAASSHKLSDTFDYKRLITETEKIMSGPSCLLIETLASSIASAIVSHPQVQKIKLTLSKRELLHGAISGITLIRSQQELFVETRA